VAQSLGYLKWTLYNSVLQQCGGTRQRPSTNTLSDIEGATMPLSSRVICNLVRMRRGMLPLRLRKAS
jgi:hypothetical protein